MKVVVFGASGVVGRAAIEHFASVADQGVIAVSRRSPGLPSVAQVAVDLGDADATARAIGFRDFSGTTRVVYAALRESPDLLSGWRDPWLMAHNLGMFRHALEPLVAHHGASLQEVNLPVAA